MGRIGDLKQVVKLHAPKQEVNSQGAISTVYELMCLVFASVTEQSSDQLENDNLADKKRYNVIIYNVNNINTRWRLSYKGEQFNIISINSDNETIGTIRLIIESV